MSFFFFVVGVGYVHHQKTVRVVSGTSKTRDVVPLEKAMLTRSVLCASVNDKLHISQNLLS